MLSVLTIPIAIASIPGGWLTEKKGYKLPSVLGLLLAIAGFALMSRWQIDTPYAIMIPHLALTGTGIGLTIAPIATAVINAAPASFRGIASALVLAFRLVGMTVGVSSITTFDLHRVETLTVQLIPAGTSVEEGIQKSMSILMTVIDETFIIAGALCLLAVFAASLLKKDPQ